MSKVDQSLVTRPALPPRDLAAEAIELFEGCHAHGIDFYLEPGTGHLRYMIWHKRWTDMTRAVEDRMVARLDADADLRNAVFDYVDGLYSRKAD